MAKKFRKYVEGEMEMSDEIIKIYNCSDKAIAKVMGISEEEVEKIRKREMNATPEQIKKLLREWGIVNIDPPKKSTYKEKRLYAALSCALKQLHRAIV
jgi:hypothetical protein